MKRVALILVIFLCSIFSGSKPALSRVFYAEKEEVTRVVVLVHGFLRTKYSMYFLEKELSLEGYHVISKTYPSVENSIEKNADYLNHDIELGTKNIEGPYELYLITHSMGGLVARCYLDKYHPVEAIRMVMIAPPNRGAIKAELFKDVPLFERIMGPSGIELTQGEFFLTELCGGPPDIEFGIIAGGQGDGEGFSSRIPGDDDGTVSVWSTYLPEAKDYLLVNRYHTFMCYYKDVIDNTKSFLESGSFILHTSPPQ